MLRLVILLLFLSVLVSCSDKTLTSENDSEIDTSRNWVQEFNDNDINYDIWSRIPKGTSAWNMYMEPENDDLFDVKDGCLILRGEVTKDTVIRTAGLWTKGKKSFGYGRLEIRAKFEGAKGSWPAMWMRPVDRYNPLPYAEIDISEKLNFDAFSYQTIHTEYNLGTEKDKYQRKSSTGRINPDDFNIYAVEHFKDSIKLYINDSLVLRYVRMPVAPDGTQLPEKEQWPFDQHFHLIIDMQISGSWAGEPDPDDYPISMMIDWIRFKEFK